MSERGIQGPKIAPGKAPRGLSLLQYTLLPRLYQQKRCMKLYKIVSMCCPVDEGIVRFSETEE